MTAPKTAAAANREQRGRTAHCSGLAAEGIVERTYGRAGWRVRDRRWRRRGCGEIDLVLERGDELAFIEVKKSASFAGAAERVTPRQRARICAAAESYLGTHPQGSLASVRFDVALVDGAGRCEIIENAFGAH
jgi:putative endonuclease